MGRRPGQGSGAAGRDLVPGTHRGQGPGGQGREPLSHEPSQTSLHLLAQTLRLFTCNELASGGGVLASFPRPSLSLDEERGQGPCSEHRWSSAYALPPVNRRSRSVGTSGPLPAFPRQVAQGVPWASNGTFRMEGGGLGQECTVPGHLVC